MAHAEVAKVIVRVLPVTHPIRLGLALNFSRKGGGARTDDPGHRAADHHVREGVRHESGNWNS